MIRTLLVMSALIGAGACANSMKSEPPPPAPMAAAPMDEWRPVGAPVKCIQNNDIRSTRIIDNQTIEFTTTGGRIYRNVLPNSCPGMKSAGAIKYSLSIPSLCSVDIFTVFDNALPNGRGATCGFGEFQQVEEIPVPPTP